MNLLYIANVRLPTSKAHGLQIMKTCEALANSGIKVKLVIATASAERDHQDPFAFYGVRNNFELRRVTVPNFFSISRDNWFYLRASLFSFKVFIKEVLGSHILYSRDWVAIMPFALFTSRKVFYESHDEVASRLGLYIAKKVCGIVCITNGLKDFFESKGIKKGRITVAPDGVDDIFFKPLDKQACRKKLVFPEKAKIAMYCGSFSLYSWKGLDVFLNAAKHVKVVFVAVGGSKDEIESLKKEHTNGNIILREKVPNRMVPEYLKAADVLVLPNTSGAIVSEKYTSPMKLFEYMASGVPIVASDLPSIREILNDKNAILVNPNNPKLLAEGVDRATTNPGDKAERALKDARNYTWPKRAERIISFIDACLRK
jgi:glycosyltransferase involved in cell wall biosynthesis